MNQIELETGDGVRLAGHCLPAVGTSGSAVVLVHGFAAHKEEASVLAAAERLAEAGYTVVTYDARGHGKSDGLCTLGDDERHDVASAVAAARRVADRVVLVGASMGAIAALRYAAEATHIDGLVTVSSPASWRIPRNPRTLFASVLTQTPPGRLVARRWLGVRLATHWTQPLPPVELASSVRVPWVIIHGRSDKFIAPREAFELRDIAPGPCRLEVVAGMGHAFDPVGVPTILEAVSWAFKAAVPAP